MKYPVINPFYWRGELIGKGAEIELTEDEAEELKPKNVLGKPTKGKSAPKPENRNEE